MQSISSPSFFLHRSDCLGSWTPPPHQHWDWYHLPWVRQLYFRTQGGWQEYRSCSICRRWDMPFQSTGVIWPSLPGGSQCATAIIDWQGVAICGCSALDCTSTPARFDSIHDLITSWKDFVWPLQDSYFPDNLAPIAQALRNGTAIRGCDGSSTCPHCPPPPELQHGDLRTPLLVSSFGALLRHQARSRWSMRIGPNCRGFT